MTTPLLIIGGIALFVLFAAVQWRAAHNPTVPLDRLPVEQQRELARFNRQLQRAANEGNNRDVYYYDGLMIGIFVRYLPDLDFIQIRHTLNMYQEEL